jgi:hypothetical protein
MKFRRPFVPLLLATSLLHATSLPAVYSWSAQNLATAREGLAHGDTALQPALDQLRKDADRALLVRPFSVMDKLAAPPSGDKHDYVSRAPYWWLDPQNPRGPYIRHDGLRNPESEDARFSDYPSWTKVSAAIETLGLAYYFTRNEAYAEHAAKLVRTWFLDPATRMNPNINFGQYVSGVNDGREEGVLEFRPLMGVCDALALLADSAAWTEKDTQAFHDWLTLYVTWVRESRLGRTEAAAVNNHGTWCDAQLADLALVLGQRDAARDLARAGLEKRLARQVEPDGRQPLELARTKSLNYSLLNLEGLFNLARLGAHVDVDWWNYTTPDGRSLRVALRYLAPYADPGKAWPKQDVVAGDRNRLFPLLAEGLRHGDDPFFRDLLTRFAPVDARWRLLWP